MCGFGLSPVGGFEVLLRTRFDRDGFRHCSRKSVPLARIRTQTSRRRYGIESEDYFPVNKTGGLLSKASLELDGPLAWHPALRDVVIR